MLGAMSTLASTIRAAEPRPRPPAPPRGRRGRTGQPLRLERRSETREPARGTLGATYSNGSRYGITQLELVDRSVSGLGARTCAEIEIGMIVTVCPEGSTVPWLTGRAVRCVREADGRYRVGLAFTRRAAA